MKSQTHLLSGPLLVSGSENPAPRQGGVPPSVQALEISVTDASIDDGDPVPAWIQTHVQHVVHRRWMPIRRRLYTAWHRSGDDQLAKRAERLNMCCASPMVQKGVDGASKTRMMRCRDRLCPLCAIKRSERLGSQLVAAVSKMDDPRHIVLTAPAVPDFLREQIDGLRHAFRALRRSDQWSGTQRGGVYSIEVTLNKKTGLWHPHLHIITDGEYIAQNTLVDEWRRALQTSGIWSEVRDDQAVVVWIERVGNRRRLADYIGKYVAKPAELESWPEDALCEYAVAMRGARLVHAFGSLHGMKLESDDEPNEQAEPGVVLAVLPIINAARRGDALAIAVCASSRAHGHAWDQWAGVDTPPEEIERVAGYEVDEEAWWNAVRCLHHEYATGLRGWLRERTPDPVPTEPPWW